MLNLFWVLTSRILMPEDGLSRPKHVAFFDETGRTLLWFKVARKSILNTPAFQSFCS